MLDDAREAFRIIQANEIWNLFGPWIEKTVDTAEIKPQKE